MQSPLTSLARFTSATHRTARVSTAHLTALPSATHRTTRLSSALALLLALRPTASIAQTTTSDDASAARESSGDAEPPNDGPDSRPTPLEATVQLTAFKAAFDRFDLPGVDWVAPGLLGASAGAMAVAIGVDGTALPQQHARLTAAAVWGAASLHSFATYAMPTRYYTHSAGATSGLLMSAIATWGYVHADANSTRVVLGTQIAGGALIAGVVWLDAYLRPPVSGITFNRLLRRSRNPGEDVEQLVVDIRSELDNTYRPVPTWIPAAIVTATTAANVYVLASENPSKDDVSMLWLSSLVAMAYGLVATTSMGFGSTQREAFEHAIDGIVVAPLPSAPQVSTRAPSSALAWSGAGVFMHGHF